MEIVFLPYSVYSGIARLPIMAIISRHILTAEFYNCASVHHHCCNNCVFYCV